MTSIVFLAALAAFLVSAVTGGGAGLVLVPLLRTIVPVETVPAALSIGTAASSLSRIAIFRRSIRWDIVRSFLPTALPSAAVGAWLLTRFEPAYVEWILGCFLLANLPAMFRARPAEAQAPPAPNLIRQLPWMGVAAGLLSGFTGAVGLVFNGVYQRLGMTRHEIVATRATNEVLLHLLKLGLYAAFGLLGRPTLMAGLLVAAAAVLASLASRWVLSVVRESLFRRIGQCAMVVAGATMFMLSSAEIADIHRAWIAVVAPGGERELQLYWGGHRRLAAEAESEGHLAIEHSIAFDALPPSVQRAALAYTPKDAITLVEKVHSPQGTSYEIYYVRHGQPEKAELKE